MGNKLRFARWGRLVALSATFVQISGSILGLLFRSPTLGIFTNATDVLFRPVPIIPLFTLISGLFILALELPLGPFTGASDAHSIRAVAYTLVGVISFFQVQTMNASLYYLIAGMAFGVAYSRDEAELPSKLPS
ncbi:uncharacterized protein VTP21DRAFT_11256 [Calcarisporiella thermophila]|uniref:uncharacterized protein n=1 Tax=Calcarisporiella thermophila TaxID=911321 RepID=UPI0037429AFA